MQGFPATINTRHDVDNLLADPDCHDAMVAHLQLLMDERYAYDASGSWGIVEPNGLTRLGLSAAEAVAMGVVDRVVAEPVFDLAAYQAQVTAQLEAERDRRLYATFSDSSGRRWIVDDRGRKMLSDRLLLVMGGMSPATWEWSMADGAGVTMTPDMLKAVCTELATWHDNHFTACRVAAGAVVVAKTRGEVDSAVAGVVWP